MVCRNVPRCPSPRPVIQTRCRVAERMPRITQHRARVCRPGHCDEVGGEYKLLLLIQQDKLGAGTHVDSGMHHEAASRKKEARIDFRKYTNDNSSRGKITEFDETARNQVRQRGSRMTGQRDSGPFHPGHFSCASINASMELNALERVHSRPAEGLRIAGRARNATALPRNGTQSAPRNQLTTTGLGVDADCAKVAMTSVARRP
jgi:hypothetical protein